MQEWIIAMLVISVLLILRDMAKTILTGRMSKKEEIFPIGEDHPQKEKVERYAAAFQKLADTFYGIPYKKEYLSSGQIERILTDANDRLCSNCYHREICWGSQAETMCQGGEALVRALEKDDEGELEKLRMQWGSVCGKSLQYLEEVREQFRQEKQNLIWMNRMIESRLAVAQQLTETAAIMETVANDLYDISAAEPEFQEELKKNLRRKHVILKAAWVMDKVEGRRQIFLTLRARSGQCVSVTEVAQMLSELCESNMTSVQGSRCIVNGEFHTIHFVEDVSYQMLYGVSRLTRENEKVSGDNYICRQEDGGRFVMCLSDGMGSGEEAFRDSTMVVEMLEELLEAGFPVETAVQMMNTALVIGREEVKFCTLDVCLFDLYRGSCEFVKAGAAATFIKKKDKVEKIVSTTLPIGVIQNIEIDREVCDLESGDYVVMVTDGVLDALPAKEQEEQMLSLIHI